MNRRRKVQGERLFLNIQSIVTLAFLALVVISVLCSQELAPMARSITAGLFIVVFLIAALLLSKKHKYGKLVWMMLLSILLALGVHVLIIH